MVRVSAVEKERYSLNRPVHFVTYFYLFQYHQQLMSCGTSQNAYHDAGEKMNSMLGQGQSVDKRVLRKAYEIFIHALHYDIEKAWSNIKENVRNARNPHLSAIPTRNVVLRWRLMAGPPPADKQGLVCMLHVSKDMDEEILYAPSPSSWSGSRSGSWSRWSSWSSWSGCSSTLSRCYRPLATTALRSKSPTLRT